MALITKILGGLAAPVIDYLNKRQEIRAEAKKQEREFTQAIHERQLKLIEQGLTADMQWETAMAEQAKTSWKDEYWTIVFSIPAIGCFLGVHGATIVKRGFEALSTTPLWYQTIFCSLVMASVGIRWWKRSQSDT